MDPNYGFGGATGGGKDSDLEERKLNCQQGKSVLILD
jgi:hypothetical protein